MPDAAPAARGVYEPRRPQASPLFRLVSDHLHRLQTAYDERFAREYGNRAVYSTDSRPTPIESPIPIQPVRGGATGRGCSLRRCVWMLSRSARTGGFVTSLFSEMTVRTEIALLTDHRYSGMQAPEGNWYYANILRDDALLTEALAEHGFTTRRLDWADPTVDWSQFRAAVFRTTWDYFERYEEFTTWLRRIERETQLINASETIWWNLDKHYLADLEASGIPTVPSVYLEAGDARTLHELFAETGWSEAVIKPCVSGTARNTYRVTAANAIEVDAALATFRAREAFMFQPFIADIVAGGELTLVVIDGVVTHGVRKVPKPGDFRVQDDHGGSWTEYVPSEEEIAFAERAVAACSPRPIYGRVDVVRGADGALQTMELEMIEPELWLRTHPAAAKRMGRAIAEAVTRP